MNLVKQVEGKLVLVATVMFFKTEAEKWGEVGGTTILELPPIHTRLCLKIFLPFFHLEGDIGGSIGSNVVVEDKIKHHLKDLPIDSKQTVEFHNHYCNGLETSFMYTFNYLTVVKVKLAGSAFHFIMVSLY